MPQLDAIKMVEAIRGRLVDFACSENYLRESRLNKICREIWSGQGKDGGLISDLWVEGAFPAELSNNTLESLSHENGGLFPPGLCDHLDRASCFPRDRALYRHQLDSLYRSLTTQGNPKPSLVVTAPTGAGKTEAFLLPLLRELWSHPKEPGEGMQCLILYPMNALVNDQVERIYGWLQGQEDLSVFHFTSATPDDARIANRSGEPLWDNCRKRTRNEARGLENHEGKKIPLEERADVPDIVITNYSMLEYMLCRPKDACFFGTNLKCIILDEAHLYHGNLAAEITLLLRRLRLRCGRRPDQILQIATSATLGGSSKELKEFASTLFSSRPEETFLIKGERTRIPFHQEIIPPSNPCSPGDLRRFCDMAITTLQFDRKEGVDALIEDDGETVSRLKEPLGLLTSDKMVEDVEERNPRTPAKFLRDSLFRSSVAKEMSDILYEERIIKLEDLSNRLWKDNLKDSIDATAFLLRLCASAREHPFELPLIPHRLHFLASSPLGVSVCLNSGCSGPEGRKIEGAGCVQPSADRCRYCAHFALPVVRCGGCGEWLLSGEFDHGRGRIQSDPEVRKQSFLFLRDPAPISALKVLINQNTGEFSEDDECSIELFKMKPSEGDELCCPHCKSKFGLQTDEASWRTSPRPLTMGQSIGLSIVGEGLLGEIPPLSEGSRSWKPAGGRRLLCFSDSRKEAARLGPFLTNQHERRLIRSALLESLHEEQSEDVVEHQKEMIQRLEMDLEKEKISDDLRSKLKDELEEKQHDLKLSLAGMKFSDLANRFVSNSRLGQVLHKDSGEKHEPGSQWTQSIWEANQDRVISQCEALIALEFDRPLGATGSLEGLGLIEVVYPGLENLAPPNEVLAKISQTTGGICANAIERNWHLIVAFLLDTLRTEQVIEWSEKDDAHSWENEPTLHGRWAIKNRSGWNAVRFTGEKSSQRRRAFVTNVLESYGFERSKAEKESETFLDKAFDWIRTIASSEVNWIRNKETHEVSLGEGVPAFQILFDKLVFRKPKTLYHCPDTDTLWSRSVNGFSPLRECQGNMIEVSTSKADENPRLGRERRAYQEDKVFKIALWAEEHSAQLNAKENSRLQGLFREGIRNVLSSTTTMELGIDIGGLNAILMGNVPPGPANYIQRSGRAGRRSDGSAVVCTYVRARPFDRAVFRDFGQYLRKDLLPPRVFLNRRQIVERQLRGLIFSHYASELNVRGTGAMDAFGRMGQFCGLGEGPEYWKNIRKPEWESPELGPGSHSEFGKLLGSLSDRSNPISEKCLTLVAGTPLEDTLNSQNQWDRFLTSIIRSFNCCLEEWVDEVLPLVESWEEIPGNPEESERAAEKAKANAIRYQIQARSKLTVIEWFSDRGFLPRYGFPINLNHLQIRTTKTDARRTNQVDERYRLERPAILALREYVPGSRLIVGGKVFTSRGITKHWTGENINESLGLNYVLTECENGHRNLSTGRVTRCAVKECDSGSIRSSKQLLFPKCGYSTSANESPKRRNYLESVGEVELLPQDEVLEDAVEVQSRLDFGGIHGIEVNYQENAEILVFNEGKNGCGFTVCTHCGYATSEEQPSAGQLPKGFLNHLSLYEPSKDSRNRCLSKNNSMTPLRNKVLAARERTDILYLYWPELLDKTQNISLGAALVLAAARLLEVDSREIGLMKPRANQWQRITLFDTAAGGAGHCFELLDKGEEWLKNAHQILMGTPEHDRSCERYCLECLLDFSRQFDADHLDRKAALSALEDAMHQQ